MTDHWAAKYVGEPWVSSDNDCWAFARKVWREQFGISVPAVDVDACSRLACSRAFAGHGEVANWSLVDLPQEGDGVLIGKNKRPSHVGVFVASGSGSILHCVQGVGVLCQDIKSMELMGFRALGFYRRAGK